MTKGNVEHPRTTEYPRVVSRAEWLVARTDLLAKEKELNTPSGYDQCRASPAPNGQGR